MSMTERPFRRQLQRDSSLYCSRVKAHKGSSGYRWKGLIGYNSAPNYHTGGRKEWDFCAESYSICSVVQHMTYRELCAGSSSEQSQASEPRDTLQRMLVEK